MTTPSSDLIKEPICPWGFMGFLDNESSHPQPAVSSPPPKAKSFASIVTNSVKSSISLSQLPAPIIRGDKTYIKINEALYQEQLKSFKTNLLGRLLLRKGSLPLKTADLRGMLNTVWRPSAPWRLVPLGKGYFDIHFATEEDLRRVWGGGTCTLTSGIFRLAQWKPDFVPGDVLPQTHAQLWVRFYGLSQDYWHPQHLMEIAHGVGTPLQLDKATEEREFGYYARVLVDVDLSRDLPSSLMIERENHCFPIEVVYENLCAHCGLAGHSSDRCRQLGQGTKKQSDSLEGVKPSRKNNSRQKSLVKHNVVADVRPAMQVGHSFSPNTNNLIVTTPGAPSPVQGLVQSSPTMGVNDDSLVVKYFQREPSKFAHSAQTDADGMVVTALPVLNAHTDTDKEVIDGDDNGSSSSETADQVLGEGLEIASGNMTTRHPNFLAQQAIPNGNDGISNEEVDTPHVLNENKFLALVVNDTEETTDVQKKIDNGSEHSDFNPSNIVANGHDMVEEDQIVMNTTSEVSLGVDAVENSGQKICWGDLENEEPLGGTVYAQSKIRFETWLDERDATSDVYLLGSLPKQKNSKKKQSGLSPRYPTRNRTPTVRMNL